MNPKSKEKAIEMCANVRGRIDEFLHDDGIKVSNDTIKRLSKRLALQHANELQIYSGGIVTLIAGQKVLLFDFWQEVKEEIIGL